MGIPQGSGPLGPVLLVLGLVIPSCRVVGIVVGHGCLTTYFLCFDPQFSAIQRGSGLIALSCSNTSPLHYCVLVCLCRRKGFKQQT